MVQRTSLQEDGPADHPGLQGTSCSPRAPGRAFSAPTESMMQWPSCWCILCRITCRFDTCLHYIHCHACTHIHGRGDQDGTPSVLSSCVLAAAPLRLRGGGVSASDGSGPSCLSCSISSGLSPAPLVSIADYNTHICTCFVLFCIFFTFLFFPGTQLGHYTCKSIYSALSRKT
jgi:hypothetical protein